MTSDQVFETCLVNLCEKVHADCNDSCPVYKINGNKIPFNPPGTCCMCFKNGSAMSKFLTQRFRHETLEYIYDMMESMESDQDNPDIDQDTQTPSKDNQQVPRRVPRYVFDFTGINRLYNTRELRKDDFIKIPYSDGHVFVNILERIKGVQDIVKIKLFYPNGTIIEGWYLDHMDTIDIYNRDLLYDGRFNQ